MNLINTAYRVIESNTYIDLTVQIYLYAISNIHKYIHVDILMHYPFVTLMESNRQNCSLNIEEAISIFSNDRSSMKFPRLENHRIENFQH